MRGAVHLEDMPRLPAPAPLFGRLLRTQHRQLKDLCFLDNEYGDTRGPEIQLLERRILTCINRQLAHGGRSLRFASLACRDDCHHHIAISWFDVRVMQPQTLVVNIYPASRRSARQDADDEEDEREGPRRGDDG